MAVDDEQEAHDGTAPRLGGPFLVAYAAVVVAGLLATYQWQARAAAVVLAVSAAAAYGTWRTSRELWAAELDADAVRSVDQRGLWVICAVAFLAGATWQNAMWSDAVHEVADIYAYGYPSVVGDLHDGLPGVLVTIGTFAIVGLLELARRGGPLAPRLARVRPPRSAADLKRLVGPSYEPRDE